MGRCSVKHADDDPDSEGDGQGNDDEEAHQMGPRWHPGHDRRQRAGHRQRLQRTRRLLAEQSG